MVFNVHQGASTRLFWFFLVYDHLSVILIFALSYCLSSNYSMYLFVNGEVLYCACENILSLSCPALEM